MNKKLLAFRITMIVFIVANTIMFGKLETESDCILIFFTFLIALSFLVAEVVHAFDDWADSNL